MPRARGWIVDRSRSDVTGAMLTERETEVLAAMARGRANPEIAAELVLSERTVRNHVSRIYTKLGVGNRVEAVLWWTQQDRCPICRDHGSGVS